MQAVKPLRKSRRGPELALLPLGAPALVVQTERLLARFGRFRLQVCTY
jgi:hypothetical protein